MARVIGIGIDAGTIGLIDELIAGGSLPNLAALRERSVRTQLDAAPNHQFGVMWPQFIAGAEAELAGEWLRFSFDRQAYEGYQTGARHRIEGNLPFWEVAQARTITLDVPSMTVAGPGVHVTAWGADAPLYPRASQPRGLLRELDARFGVHPAFETYDCGWHDPTRLERMTEACVTGAKRRAEVAVELMTRFDDWELFLTVMSEAHMASEIMWHAVEPDHPLADFDPAPAPASSACSTRSTMRSVSSSHRVPDDATIVRLLTRRDAQEPRGRAVARPPPRADAPPALRDAEAARHRCRDVATSRLPARRSSPGSPVARRHERATRPPPPRPWTHRVPGYQAARLSVRVVTCSSRSRACRSEPRYPGPPECTDDAETLDGVRDSADQFLFMQLPQHRSAIARVRASTFGGAYVRVNLAGRDAGIVPLDEFDAECRAFESFIGECRDVRTGQPVAKRVLRLGDDERWSLSFGLIASVSDSLELAGLAILVAILLEHLASLSSGVTLRLRAE